jgi:hypothetical protein
VTQPASVAHAPDGPYAPRCRRGNRESAIKIRIFKAAFATGLLTYVVVATVTDGTVPAADAALTQVPPCPPKHSRSEYLVSQSPEGMVAVIRVSYQPLTPVSSGQPL